MEKIIKLYKYVDGIKDLPFPDAENQIESRDFTYDAKRMADPPIITFQCYYGACLDNEWDELVYANFNGEKYYLKNTPSSSFSHTDARYVHDVTLVSERIVLDNALMFDIASANSSDHKPVTNSSQVYFYGTIAEFAEKINAALANAELGYTIVVDKGITSEPKQITFKDKYFSEVLKEIYNTFDIPYYFVGKTIHIGNYSEKVDTVLEYGVDNSLLSIEKNNANKKIITRITGTGSTDNIPYYYPNQTEKGTLNAAWYYNDASGQTPYYDRIKIINPQRYARKIDEGQPLYYRDYIGVINFVDKSFKYNKNNSGQYDYPENYPITECKPFNKIEFYREINITKEGRFSLNIIANVRNTYNIWGAANVTAIELKGNNVKYAVEITKNGISTTQLPIGVYALSFTLELPYLGSATESLTLQLSMEAEALGIKGWFYEKTNSTPINYELEDIGLEWISTEKATEGNVVRQHVIENSYIPPQQNLMPTTYRETKGANRFYNAVNETYKDKDNNFYVFKNQYRLGKQKEHIQAFDDIKPTIKEMTNSISWVEKDEEGNFKAVFQRIDMFSEFAYDDNDNDETEEIDGNLEYKHPYFFGKLRKFDGDFGFNLFDHTIDEGEMTISMTSGSCGGCNFVIGVDSETQKNLVQVDENGNLLKDSNGNVRCGRKGMQKEVPQEKQNDTQKNEVWIALKKDIDSFGTIMPNATNDYKPTEEEDTFVILHIDLPQSYIERAEKKLEDELIKYMHENNDDKFNFSVNFSRIYLEENPDVLAKLTENSKIKIRYNNVEYDIFIESFSYKMKGDEPLPEISIELSDELEITSTVLDNKIDDAKNEIITVVQPTQNKTAKAIQKSQSKVPANQQNGTTIDDIITTYQASYDGINPPTDEWLPTPPIDAQGMYVWSRMEIKLSNGSSRYHYSVSYQGINSNGNVPTPIFGGVDNNNNLSLNNYIKWDVGTGTVPQNIVYLLNKRLFVAKISNTDYRVQFVLNGGVTQDDYQIIDINNKTAEVHQNKTFVRVNTDELYVFNEAMGLKQINEKIKIK